jgi:hypothetical protein
MRRLVLFALCIGLLATGGGGCGGGGGGDEVHVAILFGGAGAAAPLAREADVVAKLSALGVFDSLTSIDVGLSTPVLDVLLDFDAVLVYSDAAFADPVALGDVLADYVDAGGRVVLAVFAFDAATFGVHGRFETDQYFAIPGSAGDTSGGSLTLGTVHDAGHPIMAGVSSFGGGTDSFRPMTTSVDPAATRIADWSDGTPLVAVRTIGGARRADLGFFPSSSDAEPTFWDASTDGDLLMGNALLWVAGEI